MSRTPHALIVLACDASPRRFITCRRAQSRAEGQAHARRAVVVPKPVADARSVSNNAADVARQFDHWLDGIESSGDVAGLAVAIVKDDSVLLERGVGYADWATHEPVTANTAFRLASLSKGFATALAGKLVHDGVISWDTKVAGVLPTFTLADVAGSQKLTVRDILSHRVGLPHNTYDRLLEQDEPYEVLVDRLKDVPMACPVGECYGYQNIAFSLIGDLTYAVTGDFFYHQVEKQIFHPLGMDTATYGRDCARRHQELGTSAPSRRQRLDAVRARRKLLPRAAGGRRQCQHPRHGAVADRADGRPAARAAGRRARCVAHAARVDRARDGFHAVAPRPPVQCAVRARLARLRLRRRRRWCSMPAPCRVIAR